MVPNAILKIILLTWLCLCAWLDWKYGEVSNWLTIPPLVAALGYVLVSGGIAPWFFMVVFVGVYVLFSLGNFGGADAKILVALAGFWPAAFFGSVLMQGVWGLIVLLVKGRQAKFRAIPSYATGTIISLLISVI